MKKLIPTLTVLLLFILLPVACTKKEEAGTAGTAATKIKVGLVLDRGGKDDKSFNTAAFLGATRAVNELGVELKDIECPDDAAFEPALRTFAERGFPIVIAIGFSQKDAVAKVAPQFPKTHFALVDAVVTSPNVQSLMFQEHEGSYLVGYLAGLATKTGNLGFIGGMDIALIRRFQMGYEAGVKAANPKAKVKVNYVGVTGDAWANPSRGKELALSQYDQNIDIIFHAAGASGLGTFDAAEERKKFAIGVDSNQNGVKPGRILTSMLKRVDVAVFDAIQQEIAGKFQAGTKYFGLKDQGIDLAVDSNNEKLVEPYKDAIAKVKKEIIEGTVKVPDYYEVQKTH
jgi:basic membrane protein A and related proteins